MFSLNEKVVYPGHGVARISRVFEKIFCGQTVLLFELKFLTKDMTVMVPCDKVNEVGLRPVSNTSCINNILNSFLKPARKLESFELAASNWNKRNKDYQSKMRTGSIQDVSEIYRDLKNISCYKDLSFGEKNLLNKAEELLVQEIAIAEQIDESIAIERLRSYFVPAYYRTYSVQ